MQDITTEFNAKGYLPIAGLIGKHTLEVLVNRLKELVEEGRTTNDPQCPLSDAVYGDFVFDGVLDSLRDSLSEITGRRLLPTYSYARMYRKGEVLEKHRDRPACEISATLCLGGDSIWPIYFSNTEDGEGTELRLNPGEMCLYKGTELYHWRNEFEGEWLAQVFLHYVDADGPHAEEKFDKRPHLGVPTKKEPAFVPIYYWSFDNNIDADSCMKLIAELATQSGEKAGIGSGDSGAVNTDIRNVTRVLLPVYSGVGAALVGAALNANSQAWKFDTTHCAQVEYLNYGVGGRYKPHLDTFIGAPYADCRKLTALAFLNDDFEGGKFFLQLEENKIYPPQSAGTVLVFPSFMLHGVEDVTAGTRHAVVAWVLGPYFR